MNARKLAAATIVLGALGLATPAYAQTNHDTDHLTPTSCPAYAGGSCGNPSPTTTPETTTTTGHQGGGLPFTGAEDATIALIGVGAVAVGSAAAVAKRRRTA